MFNITDGKETLTARDEMGAICHALKLARKAENNADSVTVTDENGLPYDWQHGADMLFNSSMGM